MMVQYVSKALESSRKIAKGVLPLSISERILSVISSAAYSVEWRDLK